MATTKPKLLFPFASTEPSPYKVWEKIEDHWDLANVELRVRLFLVYLEHPFVEFNKNILTVDVRTIPAIPTTVSKLLEITPIDDIVNTLIFWKHLATRKHFDILYNPDLALDYIYTVQDPLQTVEIESKDHLQSTILRELFNNIAFREDLTPVAIPPLILAKLNNTETEEDTNGIPF